MALVLGATVSAAQQPPADSGAVLNLRRGANGELEIVQPKPPPPAAPSSPPTAAAPPAAPATPPASAPASSARAASPPAKAEAPAKPPAQPPAPSPAPAPTPPANAEAPAPAPIPSAAPAGAPAPPPEPPLNPAAPHLVTPNPLLHQVVASALAVELVDFVKVPPSGPQEPMAPINFLYHAGDGSGRLFVNDMRGKIYIIRDGRLAEAPFLDVAALRSPYFISNELEYGLLTFAFHPDFARAGAPGFGKLYTIHTENLKGIADGADTPLLQDPTLPADHFTVVTEWSVDSNNPDRVDPASRREVIRFAPWRKDHAGGQLAFDPNLAPGHLDYGLLYISVGDGGNSAINNNGKVDIHHQAQNRAVPFGKILRINPLAQGTAHYAVPGNNPFVNLPGVLPEIWAYGLRNPERFSWDLGGQHRMLIADIGQYNIEEINLGRPGANYGWSAFEGKFVVDHEDEKNLISLPEKTTAGFTFPVAAYDHSDGYAVIGGFVYRGRNVPQLTGQYIFGDIVSGDIFYADADILESGREAKIYKLKLFYHGRETFMRPGVIGNDGRVDLRFGLDQDGEIYVLTKADGMIRKLTSHAP